MTTNSTHPYSRRGMIMLVGSAAASAVLVLVGAVLPAEFNRDPLGIGRLTGIGELWAPAETSVSTKSERFSANRSINAPIRRDSVTFTLEPGGDPGGSDQLEYKAFMPKGASYLYEWQVAGTNDPEQFYSEFHGHTSGAADTMLVADYRKASGLGDKGILTAPFSGIHGWYFQNQSDNKVTVTLHLTGFYELVAPGKAGNEAGIVATPKD